MKRKKGKGFKIFLILVIAACAAAYFITKDDTSGYKGKKMASQSASPDDSENSAKTSLNVGWRMMEALETMRPDASWTYDAMGAMFWQCVYSQLWMIGPPPDYNPVPVLAEKWETDDRKTWRFYLRKDAVFHDGKPVTAKDVLFSIKALNYAGGSGGWATDEEQSMSEWWSADAETVSEKNKIIDKYTLEITLKNMHAHPKYPPVAFKPILPEHIWKEYKWNLLKFDNTEAIGSGPWMLKKFVSGEYIWFDKFEGYFGDQPGFDQMVWKTYGTRDTMNLALKGGKIDFEGYPEGLPFHLVDHFKKDPKYDVIESKSLGIDWIVFNFFQSPHLSKLNVRKAIMHGISKDRIQKMAYQGFGVPIDSFLDPDHPNYHPNLPQYDYNPEKAKELLAGEGYVDTDGDGILNDPETKNNLEFEMMMPFEWYDWLSGARLIIEMLKEVGLKLNLNTMDYSTYLQYLFDPTEKKYDLALYGNEPGPYGDWMWDYLRSYDKGYAGWNPGYYNNNEYDRILSDFNMESDPEKRKEYEWRLQEIVAEDLPFGMLTSGFQIDAVRNDRVKDYVVSMGGISNWINPWTYFKAQPVTQP